jgi:hypothetical protein
MISGTSLTYWQAVVARFVGRNNPFEASASPVTANTNHATPGQLPS